MDRRPATLTAPTARSFSLGNASGFRAEVADLGASLVRLFAPDRLGRLEDVVLGFNSPDDYADNPFFLGATIGRYANRIASGRFTVDDVVCQLTLNDGPPGARRHLHGGRNGFHRRRWQATRPADPTGEAVRFALHSPAGEEGYPGNLQVTVTYAVATDRNDLRIDYTATTDRPTPINLTNHAYFNLRGDVSGDILGHVLKIEAAAYTPVDAAFIPRGERAPVAGTPFDFRAPRAIGKRIDSAHEQLVLAGGYDHNYVLDSADGSLAPAATVREPESGRVLEVLTTEPGLQFYSGNFLSGPCRGKSGRSYERRSGFCLETQHFPDSPNQPSFPSTILRPGQRFQSTTIYRFPAVS